MICCIECFLDAEIKSLIGAEKREGNCPLCGCENTFIYDTSIDVYLESYFDDLLDVYESRENLPENYPIEFLGTIGDRLREDWNIFNIAGEQIMELIAHICRERLETSPAIFTEIVGNPKLVDVDFLNNHSLLRTYQWEDFVFSIKNINRFHSNQINNEILGGFCKDIEKRYKKGMVFYRARISTPTGFKKTQLGAPPSDAISVGRANSIGIRCLYLADNEETAIREIRAGAFDYLTIGKFILQKDMKIIDLTKIDKSSPFVGMDYERYSVNLRHLKKISNDIARPLSRQDSQLDYLPTQYIVDYIKSLGYYGVEYKSTLSHSGNNFALFDEKNSKCTKAKVCQVKELLYKYE